MVTLKSIQATLIVIIMLLVWAMPASAHGLFVRSDPNPNAVLEKPPVQVQVWLTEPVESSFSEIKVLDTKGVRVDDGITNVDPNDPTHIQVGLRSLSNGVYTASWKALSVVDGHVTFGTFPFSVGEVDPAALAAAVEASSGTVAATPGEVIPRWLSLLGIAILIGGSLFVAYVWTPAWRQATEASPFLIVELFRMLQRSGLVLFIGTSIFSLLWHVSSATGLEFTKALFDAGLGELLFSTRYGLLWLFRTALAATVALSDTRSWGWLYRVRPFVLGSLVVTLSLNSHLSAAQSFLPIVSNSVHVVAASVWIGGLLHFAIGIWLIRDLEVDTRICLIGALVRRFSNIGLLTVGTLLLTGVFNASMTVGSMGALFSSPYGTGILIKLGVITPMLVLAAINLLVIRPRLQSTSPKRGVLHLRRVVTAEAILGVCVLAAAGILATIPPVRTFARQLVFQGRAEDLTVRLAIIPGYVGVNQFDVHLVDISGKSVTDADEVRVRFTPLSAEIGQSNTRFKHIGDGHYTLQGSYLSLPGEWQAQVVVRRSSSYDTYTNFNFQVSSLGKQAGAAATRPTFARYAAFILITSGLLYALVLRGLIKGLVSQIVLGLVPSGALISVGAGVFVLAGSLIPPQVVNPIAPDASSLRQGQSIYESNCLVCHGPRGLGDGPVGITLNPPPANLQDHMVVGVHTDGQIMEWITYGYPDSVMVGFGDVLNEDERWHLLNYIRTILPE